MSVTVLPVLSEAVQVQELATYLVRLSHTGGGWIQPDNATLQEFKALVSDNKYAEALEKAMAQQDVVFSKASDADLENFWVLLATLAIKVTGQNAQKILTKVLDIVQGAVDERKAVRLTIMNHLYNLYDAPSWRQTVLGALFKYAKTSGQAASVRSALTNLDGRLKALATTHQQRRALLAAAVEVAPEDETELIADMQKKLLLAFEANELAESKEATQKVVAWHIKTPQIFYFDTLFHIPAVEALKGQSIFELLEVFSHEDYHAFVKFAAKNGGTFSAAGLDQSALATKMRLLTLGHLGAQKPTFTFAEIAKALDVSESEVELWVIEATGMGIVDARIDQLSRTVTVLHAPHRAMRAEQWTSLGKRVQDGREHIKALLEVVQKSKASITAGNAL